MKLYKYYKPESKKIILLESGGVSFRFSQKEALNDPFELTPVINNYPEELQAGMEKKLDELEICPLAKMLINQLVVPEITKDFSDAYKELAKYNFGILSFSRKKDHRSLWAYYGKDHTGFMVSIDHKAIKIPESKNKFFRAVKFNKVTYTHKRPQDRSDIFNTFFVKDNAWCHESEYRWIAPLNCFPNKEKTNDNTLDIHTLTVPRSSIDGVYIGAYASENTTSYIKIWANDNNPRVKVYKAVPCDLEFKFNYIKI
tara:strand:+ start:82056 stop:82823 length:768 start_codon:yes stop_codon:yes gene_type:complete